MTILQPFQGKILSSSLCELGEGPTFEVATNTLWWFDILGKKLHELQLTQMKETAHSLPVMGSVAARVDDQRQLIATEKGVFLRDRKTNELTLHCELEPGRTENRSNDGRVHPSGSLWIGTMGKSGESGSGAIYHVARGKVTTLYERLSIPNSICFSPDGSVGYFVDTKVNKMMRVPLDPDTGLPAGEASVFVDGSSASGGIDGSICDARGQIWNARWGEGSVDHYDTDGRLVARYALPAKRTTCPVYLGPGRLAITSSWEGLDEAGRAADPLAGALFEIAVTIEGQPEPSYRT